MGMNGMSLQQTACMNVALLWGGVAGVGVEHLTV